MKGMPTEKELLDKLMSGLHEVLNPLAGQEITAEMKARVNGVIESYFEQLENKGWVEKPYPCWRLHEQDGGLMVEFHKPDMDHWMAAHPTPKDVQG